MADSPERPRAVSVDVVRPLRQEILRPDQPSEALVYPHDGDPETLHVAVCVEKRVVGVATVMRDPYPRDRHDDDWRIRGMATNPELRNRGIGSALLAACEGHVRAHHGGRLWCNARVNARAFYERGGLAIEGEVFEIPTIGAHYLMSKTLHDRGARPHEGAPSRTTGFSGRPGRPENEP
jgi:GNAT superfamily N-acetyltransferase